MSAIKEVVERQGAILKRRSGSIDVVRRAIFIRELMRSPVVGTAARLAGLTRRAVYLERERSDLFRRAWDECLEGGAIDQVEGVLIEKAKGGDIRAIDMVLKAHRPERYRERHEVAVVSDSVIEVNLVSMDKSLETSEE